jgi:hypothetical protein
MSNNPIGPSSVSSRRYFLCDEKKNAQQKTKKERNRERNMLIDHYPPHLFCVGAFNSGSKRKQFCGVPAVGTLFFVARGKQKTKIQNEIYSKEGKDELNHFLHKCSALSSD